MEVYMNSTSKCKNYVNYGNEILPNYGDFHTHTIYSLHGMSSPSEMVDAAIDAGLSYIALTDHHVPYSDSKEDNMSDFINRSNQIARAYEIRRSFEGLDKAGIIKVIPGYEYNLYVGEDNSSFVPSNIPHLRNIGYHTWYADLKYTTIYNYLEEINKRLSTGKYKVFVHPERDIDQLGITSGEFLNDEKDRLRLMDGICSLCDKYGIVIECNNSSIANPLNSKIKTEKNIERMKCWIRKAQLYGLNIVVNSDSHVKYTVGKCDEAFELLSSMGVDKNKIVNFDKDMIEDLIVPK